MQHPQQRARTGLREKQRRIRSGVFRKCRCPEKTSTPPRRSSCADKYAVAGDGETAYTRGSNMTTRALATIAVHNAMLDAGLKASGIDGMLSY
jgi:hypothetical protein